MATAKRQDVHSNREAIAWTARNIDTDRYTVQKLSRGEHEMFDMLLMQMPFGSQGPRLIGVAFEFLAAREMVARPSGKITEAWIVDKGGKRNRKGDPDGVVRVSWDDFRRMVALRPPPVGGLRTTRGKAMVANHQQISISVSALVVLIDRRIAELGDDRPNSAEGIAEKEEKLEHLKRLKRDILALVNASRALKAGKVKEAEAVKASTTLSDGVQKWWAQDHKQICARAFDVGIFGSAVGICVMAGAGGGLAVGVAAAIAGGKKLTDALKSLKGVIKVGQTSAGD